MELTCVKRFPDGTRCGAKATLAYLTTEGKRFVYRCEQHPINNKKRAWNQEYMQCRKIPIEEAIIMEVMTA